MCWYLVPMPVPRVFPSSSPCCFRACPDRLPYLVVLPNQQPILATCLLYNIYRLGQLVKHGPMGSPFEAPKLNLTYSFKVSQQLNRPWLKPGNHQSSLQKPLNHECAFACFIKKILLFNKIIYPNFLKFGTSGSRTFCLHSWINTSFQSELWQKKKLLGLHTAVAN